MEWWELQCRVWKEERGGKVGIRKGRKVERQGREGKGTGEKWKGREGEQQEVELTIPPPFLSHFKIVYIWIYVAHAVTGCFRRPQNILHHTCQNWLTAENIDRSQKRACNRQPGRQLFVPSTTSRLARHTTLNSMRLEAIATNVTLTWYGRVLMC